ncbi:MAG: hypothetical protein FD169_2052 [Bacillota bacterium]|nr:MAG: hypothetical protein FD169_2052 [Bacillota bacterium]
MAPKKKDNTPRRRRMDRKTRLQVAPACLATFTGKNVVRVYGRWFGVDQLTAAVELQMLDVALPPRHHRTTKSCYARQGASSRKA